MSITPRVRCPAMSKSCGAEMEGMKIQEASLKSPNSDRTASAWSGKSSSAVITAVSRDSILDRFSGASCAANTSISTTTVSKALMRAERFFKSVGKAASIGPVNQGLVYQENLSVGQTNIPKQNFGISGHPKVEEMGRKQGPSRGATPHPSRDCAHLRVKHGKIVIAEPAAGPAESCLLAAGYNFPVRAQPVLHRQLARRS